MGQYNPDSLFGHGIIIDELKKKIEALEKEIAEIKEMYKLNEQQYKIIYNSIHGISDEKLSGGDNSRCIHDMKKVFDEDGNYFGLWCHKCGEYKKDSGGEKEIEKAEQKKEKSVHTEISQGTSSIYSKLPELIYPERDFVPINKSTKPKDRYDYWKEECGNNKNLIFELEEHVDSLFHSQRFQRIEKIESVLIKIMRVIEAIHPTITFTDEKRKLSEGEKESPKCDNGLNHTQGACVDDYNTVISKDNDSVIDKGHRGWL